MSVARAQIEHVDQISDDLGTANRGPVPTGFHSRTFEGVRLNPDERELMDEIYTEASEDADVRIIISDFERRGDRFTSEHMQRTCEAALQIGVRMQLSRERLSQLAKGMMIHDLGKRFQRELIYLPRELRDEERRQLDLHPALGVAFARGLGINDPVLLGIIGYHHAYSTHPYDAEDAVAREDRDVELEQIAAVADMWDALCSQRPYPKPVMSPQEAAKAIHQQARVEHGIVQAFESLLHDPAHIGQMALSA